MKRKNILSAVSALALLFTCGNTAVIPVNAEDTATTEYTVKGDKDRLFSSYILMSRDASVPKESISYTIQPYGTAATTEATGNPSVGTAEFNINTATYIDTMDISSDINTSKKNTDGTTRQDDVVVTSTQKYARTSVAADFSAVTFKAVDTYEYLITEDQGNDPAMTYDSSPMIMQVYVVYDTTATGVSANKALKVDSYVMYKATKTMVNGNPVYTINDGTNSTTNTKADGFVNEYTTKSLKIEKKVTGNQASHDEYFEFDVNLTNTQPGMKYKVNIQNADALTTINGLSTTAHTNRDFIEANASGVATETFWLHTGQWIIITNVPVGTNYSVNENAAQMTTEKYTTTAVITGDTINGAGTTVQLLQSGKFININEAETGLSKSVATLSFTTDKKLNVYVQQYTRNEKNANYTLKSDNSSNPDTYDWTQPSATTIQASMLGNNDPVTYTFNADRTALTELDSGGKPVDYTASAVTGEVPVFAAGKIMGTEDKATALEATTLKVADSYLSDNTEITFTNEKHGVVPTGIMTTTVPYVLIVLVGLGGLLIFAKKRNEEAEEAEEE